MFDTQSVINSDNQIYLNFSLKLNNILFIGWFNTYSNSKPNAVHASKAMPIIAQMRFIFQLFAWEINQSTNSADEISQLNGRSFYLWSFDLLTKKKKNKSKNFRKQTTFVAFFFFDLWRFSSIILWGKQIEWVFFDFFSLEIVLEFSLHFFYASWNKNPTKWKLKRKILWTDDNDDDDGGNLTVTYLNFNRFLLKRFG